jgi:hypothetical protein
MQQGTDSGRDEEVLFHPFALTIILRKRKKVTPKLWKGMRQLILC